MTKDDIKNNGVIGAGGAGFPTHVKLDSKPEIVIMNAAECEPLLHKDIELLKNYPDKVIDGFRCAMELTGAKKGIIGIKEKHHELITSLKKRLNGNIEILPVGDFYPAGDEVTLVHLTTGRIIQPGGLPISVGCLVQNVETLYNLSTKKPVVEKFISVAGAVEQPVTIKVPVGITYAEVLSQYKILIPNYVIRAGGLMMGALVRDLNQVIDKRTGALIVLPVDHFCVTMYDRYSDDHSIDRIAKAGCDQCNFCTEFCPRYLLGHPVRPETAMRNRMFSQENEPVLHTGNEFCCECNLCTMYACPESLDPKGATLIEKKMAQKQESKWQGLPVSAHPMIEYRKVPTKKLMQRLDVLMFKDEGPLSDVMFKPKEVRIPLSQHIGAPAKPIVEINSRVKKYDTIGKSQDRISADIHASIDGIIKNINDNEIIIRES